MKKRWKARLAYTSRELIQEVQEDDVLGLAAQVAYYFIVSLVPFLIAFINLSLFFAASNINFIQEALHLVPDQTTGQLYPLIENIIKNRATGFFSNALAVGVGLWSSSKAIGALLASLDQASGIEERDSFIINKAKALVFTVLILLVIFIVTIFMILGNVLLDSFLDFSGLDLSQSAYQLFSSLRYLIPVAMMILVFTLFYRYGPSHQDRAQRLGWATAIKGGTLCTVGWVLVSIFYNYYMTRFSKMPLTYGPLFGIFAMITWFYISAAIITLALEITLINRRFNENWQAAKE